MSFESWYNLFLDASFHFAGALCDLEFKVDSVGWLNLIEVGHLCTGQTCCGQTSCVIYDVRWYALNSFHIYGYSCYPPTMLFSLPHVQIIFMHVNVTPAAGCYFSSNGALPSTSLLSQLTQFRLVSHIKAAETAHIVQQKVCIWQPLRSASESNTEFAEVSVRQGIHLHPERYVGVNTESSASQKRHSHRHNISFSSP